eukprot:1373637-Alexandrium_andersonii.AAC.1
MCIRDSFKNSPRPPKDGRRKPRHHKGTNCVVLGSCSMPLPLISTCCLGSCQEAPDMAAVV